MAFPNCSLEVCWGRGWEHLGLKGWSTFNSVFCAVEQLLKEGNHHALEQQLALLWHMLKCSHPSPGKVKNYVRCKGRCPFSTVSPVWCLPEKVLCLFAKFLSFDILGNRELKGRKMMIPLLISRFFAYDQYLKLSAEECWLWISYGFLRGRKGELYIITGKVCLALKLHLWFQLVNSQL